MSANCRARMAVPAPDVRHRWVVLTLLVTVGDPFFGRIALWYTAFVLYAGIAGVPLALVLPFQWHDLYADGMTAPLSRNAT